MTGSKQGGPSGLPFLRCLPVCRRPAGTAMTHRSRTPGPQLRAPRRVRSGQPARRHAVAAVLNEVRV